MFTAVYTIQNGLLEKNLIQNSSVLHWYLYKIVFIRLFVI